MGRVGGMFVALAMMSVGCGSGLPNDRAWGSDHFSYHSRSGDGAVCPDIVGVLEQHLAVMQGVLGINLPGADKIDYFKFKDQGDLNDNGDCDEGIACAPRSAVESAAPFDSHELIH